MNKNNHNQQKSKILEKIKWLSILFFFLLLLFFTYYFYTTQLLIRIFITLLLILCIGGVFISTKKGKHIISCIIMSTKEMKKIIWPTYKDTLYTTLIIISVTILISFLLWCIDSIIFRLIAFIISLRF
ncbi:preprotein translocase subunit SecE [Buchnera aphidicola]|uniref:Protein translocase subunit SecE n=1 Tax=Buchnera aphidicola str. Ua (Uroleucon ambrosiae) TaxID=1005057 RepID=G2LNT6_BUCUM|nr:preprotein translocase subunit SecE [Buchnera aphidicola]AEO07873.1 preprotein translocase subunit SecE [Buchnera aphidicola str. Ua (Uroleucon ambrosiae)]